MLSREMPVYITCHMIIKITFSTLYLLNMDIALVHYIYYAIEVSPLQKILIEIVCKNLEQRFSELFLAH